MASNVSQAMRLLEQSRFDVTSFVGKLYEAHAITKDRMRDGRVAKPMAFYFVVVRDLVGLREPAGQIQANAGSSTGSGQTL